MKTSKIALFFKGMAMGTVDIVPGVSGSTVAVLLGIYERFIAALKNINLTLIKAFFRPFSQKFSRESRDYLKSAAQKADFPWLLILLSGLATAFVVASFIIPALMERFPQIMRGIFFGLVLGSIITPIRSIHHWKIPHFLTIALFAAAFFFILGQHFSPPTQLEFVTAQQGDTLESICREAPCFNPPADVLALNENAPLQDLSITSDTPLPAGIQIAVPKPYAAFCLLAGFLAICAMLLPGISGSFILLVLGCYYFMLNTGKSFLSGLAHGDFLGMHLVFLGCFIIGALTGIALFSRALTWLFNHFRELTLAAIIGILIGCLRAIWPFRLSTADGLSQNIFPDFSTTLFWPTIIAILAGLSIVTLTLVVQHKLDKQSQQDP